MMNHKILIQGQYLKDLSVENPNAPSVFNDRFVDRSQQTKPEIMFNVKARPVNKEMNVFEMIMEFKTKLNVFRHKEDPKYPEKLVAYICELNYGTIAQIVKKDDSDNSEISEEDRNKLLLVELPHMIFPYIRKILGDNIAMCGFPPIMLDPIDFKKTYEDNLKVDVKTES
ncbi:MAG: SecB [Candidatus Xenolissoclinum pacificiensis L6]|uniref:SecB n=1 Tax=Candidatus Xenolissoclinum pacificiensis L6 TaxID=1401685 RepID=W2UZR0_9RICK|nr:MAG: SecB [Candidatus Xenolissoclinum pacificiensis L6]